MTLHRYKGQGCQAVLALESNDFALVNRDILHKDFQTATSSYSPTAIDHVLLVQTGMNPWCVTPLWYDGAPVEEVQATWPTAPGYPWPELL